MYVPGSPAFNLNEIALGIRRDLEWTEQTAKRENLPLENLDVQFPVNPGYRQYTAWLKAIEQARDLLQTK